jgi:RNA polymerase sigma-70 factor (ECF subfamily)
MAPSDEQLLTQYKQGDPRAFRTLVQRYTTPIYNLALHLLGDAMEAENVTQETFLRVVASVDRVRLDLPFRPFLFRIAVNLCRDFGRKKRPLLFSELDGDAGGAEDSPIPSEGISDDAPPLWERVEKEEVHIRLYAAMSALPPSYRTILVLRYLEDLSYEELARALNLPLNTVRTHLHRAKAQLKRELEKNSHLTARECRGIKRLMVEGLAP